MPSIGPGVIELRIHTDREHRLLYLAKLREAVYVLHAFEKKSRKTLKKDVELARKRLAQLAQYGQTGK
jgi:phage-related protein